MTTFAANLCTPSGIAVGKALMGHAPRSLCNSPSTEVRAGVLGQQHGCLRLSAGRAVTVKAKRPGMLRVAQGRIWATFGCSKPRQSGAGDCITGCGEGLPVLAGQAVVLESFALGDGAGDASGDAQSAYFTWEPLAPVKNAGLLVQLRSAVN